MTTRRRHESDGGTEERRRSGEIELGGDAQNELLIDDDAIGVAAIGDASEVLVGDWGVTKGKNVGVVGLGGGPMFIAHSTINMLVTL
jgi:hypothetical protein